MTESPGGKNSFATPLPVTVTSVIQELRLLEGSVTASSTKTVVPTSQQ